MGNTTPEYLELLLKIQNTPSKFTKLHPAPGEPLYVINLDTRKVGTPTFLSLRHDHNSETVWFQCPRYYDNVDLARDDIQIIIQFENANPDISKRGFIYPIPYKDIETPKNKDVMYLPWILEGPATAYSGDIKFAFRFYKIRSTEIKDEDFEDLINGHYFEYEYNLNTLPSTSRVLHGLDATIGNENYQYNASTIEAIYQRINEIATRWFELYE